MAYFKITKAARDHLSKRDPKLGAHIAKCKIPRRELFESPFECLVCCIIQQQISGAVAEKISERAFALLGDITPARVLKAGAEKLRACGISGRKAESIIALAEAAKSGALNFGELKSLPDAEVCARLCAFQGVGAWTAEMFLIFCLGRPDVFSPRDFGVRSGFEALHGRRADIKKYAKKYSPYGSAASIYYWQTP